MQGELVCEGKIRFGPLPWETSERLAQFSGNWLQYAPEENALVVRKPLPSSCPAFTAVPCELISLIYSIPAELRDSMPGGCLYIKDGRGDVVRIVVERGDVRVQWPREDYARPVSIPVDAALKGLDPKAARVKGWARFAGACERAGDLQKFVERFGGLYPEGDLPSECEQNLVYVRFKDVNIGPKELIAKLQELAESQESLQAELDVSSFAPDSAQGSFRLRIRDGQVSAMRPSAWKQGKQPSAVSH